MKITASQLKRIIREEISRVLVEASDESTIQSKDGKVEITVGNRMFDFSPDELAKALSKPRWVVDSDEGDIDAGGATIMKTGKSAPPTISMGGPEFPLDEEELKKVVKSLS